MANLDIPVGRGAMRHTVQLQARTEAPDAYGQLVATWATVDTYRAAIDQSGGSVPVDAGQPKPQRTGTITMAYFGPIDQKVQRFLFEGRVLNITNVDNVGERNMVYKIDYEETVGAQP